jgi:predicted transcriptional regulator
MKTVIFDVASAAEVKQRVRAAFAGNKQTPRISFASPELLFRVMTANRWDVIRTMAGAEPMAVRELARRLDRDVKSVHGDVQALLTAGVLRKAEGGIVFPYDAVHVNFIVKAA